MAAFNATSKPAPVRSPCELGEDSLVDEQKRAEAAPIGRSASALFDVLPPNEPEEVAAAASGLLRRYIAHTKITKTTKAEVGKSRKNTFIVYYNTKQKKRVGEKRENTTDRKSVV